MPVRSIGIVLIPVIAVGLAAALLLSVRSSAQAPVTVAQPLAAATARPALVPAEVPVDKPPLPAAAPTPRRAAGYVALVDNKLILRADFDLAQAIDQAMSALLGIAPAAPDQLLQQMVNHHLVMREANKAGAKASESQARLAELLAGNGKTQAELDETLNAYHVDPAQFAAYLAELVLVDQFAHQTAARQGTTVDAYLGSLQAAARIHLGDPLTATVAVSSPVEPAPPDAGFPPAVPTATSQPVLEAAPPAAADEKRGVVVGQLAPLFELPTLGAAGRKTTFGDLLGKPAVLSFWTTWCPYCLRQTPIMVRGAARYAATAVQFVGVDVSEKAGVVAPYVTQHAIPYPILLDTDGQTAAAYAVEGYPTTYFLDARGRIVAHHIGAMSDEELTTYVEQLLSSK